MPIEVRGATIEKVRLSTRTSDGIPLFIEVSDKGFEFFVTESSAGNSHDKPIHMSVDQIWKWVESESGGKKPLKDRAAVKRAIAKSSGN